MADVVLSIGPAVGVAAPTNPPSPPTTPFESVFDRELDSDEVGGPSSSIRDVVRGYLDAGLVGSVALPDPVPGSLAEVRFLTGTGSLKEITTVRLPGGATSTAQVDLSAAQVVTISAPEPRPPTLPGYVRRDARFVPIDGGWISFATARLAVAPVTVSGGGWARLGLDKLFALPTAATVALPYSGALPSAMAAEAWTPIHLPVDGQFTARFEREPREAWLWWLTGSVGAIGVVVDDLTKDITGLTSIPLPPLPTVATDVAVGRVVPADVTEREVADNPAIYTEDPGAFCKPFSNPERVLGERSFNVIFRAEQPIVSPEASVRTVTGPLLDFELPAAVRDSILTADTRQPSLLGRVATALRLRSVPARAASTAIRFPVLNPIVTHDVVPTEFNEEVQGADRGRRAIDAQHPVQWDSDASRYQAVTVARGHILEFRLRWRSNGYSLGTVAKTLTLAARQVKRIQKIEWRRIESARREERTQLVDHVGDVVSRDRQYEDGVEATLSEWARGESESSMRAGAGGFGFAAGSFVIGGGGGGSNASSSSSQEGGRRTTASEEQRLRDSVRRYGDSLRRLDSVVVNEVTQEETVTGTVEIVRNPNFGHALTVIYYQILRHLKVETAFAGVRECLFVPFAIKPFTVARASRWRDLLRRGLLDRRFEQPMRYLKDVLTGFAGSDIPAGRRSEQQIRHVSGSLYMRLAVARPRDTDDGAFDVAAWAIISPYLSVPAVGIFAQLLELAEARRERQFQEEHAPGIAAAWVNTMRIEAGTTPLHADLTLATRYQFNGVVRVDFSVPVGNVLTREMLASIRVFATRNLPPNSVANLTRVTITYQTDQFQRSFSVTAGTDDLVLPQTGVRDLAGARLFALPDMWERQDVRAEMVRAVNDLVGHLNEHAEHYHKVIWWNMDRDRVFMLVDGFEVPGANGTSIGSVIERDPIAIIGNSLVFRVSAGSFLGLGDIITPAQLYNYYATHQPVADPMLISLPTDGLYAQTIMDECEALEEHYGSTDWVLADREPELGELDPSLLTSRRAEPQPATPTPFPQTLINLQNAPEAPAPAGLADVLNAVTNPNAFRDMAGLAATQANAATALQTAAGLASSFGAQAAALKLAQAAKAAQDTQSADQRLATIQRAATKQLVSPEEARDHAGRVLEELHAPTPTPPHENPQISNAIEAAAGMPGSTIEATTPDGQARVTLASNAAPPLAQECGFRSRAGRLITVDEVRAEVVSVAEAEQVSFWTTGTGALLTEDADTQFEHLVRYWLEVRPSIPAANMGAIALALGDSTTTSAAKYLRLLNPPGEPQANINADAQTVAANLIAGVPAPTTPGNLQALVVEALMQARRSRLGHVYSTLNQQQPLNERRPWSACFVNACIRGAERNLDLEPPTGAAQALLGLTTAGRHWEYVREAHRRRFGCRLANGSFDQSCRRDGTYHAFAPDERPVERGDIIIQDRRGDPAPNKTHLTVAGMFRFSDSQSRSNEGDMHGDIVVDVVSSGTNPYAETIGGNVGDSARRRRYPLNPDGTLVVDLAQNFVQQQDSGSFPALPSAPGAGTGAINLDSLSTRRIFALLSPVEECNAILGQQGGADIDTA